MVLNRWLGQARTDRASLLCKNCFCRNTGRFQLHLPTCDHFTSPLVALAAWGAEGCLSGILLRQTLHCVLLLPFTDLLAQAQVDNSSMTLAHSRHAWERPVGSLVRRCNLLHYFRSGELPVTCDWPVAKPTRADFANPTAAQASISGVLSPRIVCMPTKGEFFVCLAPKYEVARARWSSR